LRKIIDIDKIGRHLSPTHDVFEKEKGEEGSCAYDMARPENLVFMEDLRNKERTGVLKLHIGQVQL
jgi:hypothetical protein